MPRRKNNISDRKNGEAIDDFPYDVDHQAQIDVLGIEEINEGGGKYLLEITDEKNLDNSVLFEVVINAEGRVTNFQACADFRTYSNIKFEYPLYRDEIKREIKFVLVMGNDLGETFYHMLLKRIRYIEKAFELEVIVSLTEPLTYSQASPDRPLALTDEDDA